MLHDVEIRALVKLDVISPEMITSVITVEDAGFRRHNGVNAAAIARALVRNVSSGAIEQGGSTIAKQEILEAYLDKAYFGGASYGVCTAAEGYFGIEPSQLDWGQSALLVSLISNPVRYDPTRFPDVAITRRRPALKRLPRAEDRWGKILSENKSHPTRVISAQSPRLVTDVLAANARGGIGTRARLESQPAAGKTGTVQNFGDAWFVGFTPRLATAVWMGNPGAQVSMRGVAGFGSGTGGSAPARIRGVFNNTYQSVLPVLKFHKPEPASVGVILRTDSDTVEYKEMVKSLCGDPAAKIDTDGDGVPDGCQDLQSEYDPNIGTCPTLLEPVDVDEDGRIDACVPLITTTTISAAPTATGRTTASAPTVPAPPLSPRNRP